MKLSTSALSVIGTLVVSGSDLVIALPSVSLLHKNNQLSPLFPASGAVSRDFQLIDGQVGVQVNPKPIHAAAYASSCFPALDFAMPSQTPANLDNWWCDATDEYAFLGFSYEISDCESIVVLICRP
jgi:hypothetical protein